MKREHEWLNYIIIIIFTSIIVSIITENAVLKRVSYSEGVHFSLGKCRLKEGYGKINQA